MGMAAANSIIRVRREFQTSGVRDTSTSMSTVVNNKTVPE
jgi:hypothetical protein